jgi:hypothetical protein
MELAFICRRVQTGRGYGRSSAAISEASGQSVLFHAGGRGSAGTRTNKQCRLTTDGGQSLLWRKIAMVVRAELKRPN